MPALYKPPTKWPTVEISWLTLVQRADPLWGKRKHREAEYAPWYAGIGRPFYADPYARAPFDTPKKTTTEAYTGPMTFAAGDLTGVGYDIVTFVSTGTAPGTLTTRTAAQMFADIPGAVPN